MTRSGDVAERPAEVSSLCVSDEVAARYRDDGYIVLPPFVDGDELAWLRHTFDELFLQARNEAMAAGRVEDADPMQVHAPERLVPELRTSFVVRAARPLAAQLLGAPAETLIWGSHMIVKRPRSPRVTHWHQDEAYFPANFEIRGLSVWIALDDATVDNGCMNYVPGSHRIGVVPHKPVLDRHGRPAPSEFEACELPGGAVPCPVPVGAATVHDYRTLHYTGPNVTDGVRRAYILIFATPRELKDVFEPRPWLDA